MSHVKKYHVYQAFLTSVKGEYLQSEWEPDNAKDIYAVYVNKNEIKQLDICH